MKEQENYSGIDLFSGAGGMSIGAEMAGINVKYAIENNHFAALTFKENHPNSIILEKDISTVSPLDLNLKSPFVLFGGPPCQGFSFSNTKSRTLENPNNHLFEEYLRFVKVLNPRWVVFENVEGFKRFEKGGVATELELRLKHLGYNCESAILWASDYGVPQNRNRFFLVANNSNVKYTFPEVLDKKVTVWEAIADLPKIENGSKHEELPYKNTELTDYMVFMRRNSNSSKQNLVSKNNDYVINRYSFINQGQNWRAIPQEHMGNYKILNNTHSGIYRRLDANKPSVVISNYRKNMLIHPFENRGLSVREAARLQSFPDNFIFKGSLMHMQQQIGNAVPPLLAKAVFDKIIQLDKKVKK